MVRDQPETRARRVVVDPRLKTPPVQTLDQVPEVVRRTVHAMHEQYGDARWIVLLQKVDARSDVENEVVRCPHAGPDVLGAKSRIGQGRDFSRGRHGGKTCRDLRVVAAQPLFMLLVQLAKNAAAEQRGGQQGNQSKPVHAETRAASIDAQCDSRYRRFVTGLSAEKLPLSRIVLFRPPTLNHQHHECRRCTDVGCARTAAALSAGGSARCRRPISTAPDHHGSCADAFAVSSQRLQCPVIVNTNQPGTKLRALEALCRSNVIFWWGWQLHPAASGGVRR